MLSNKPMPKTWHFIESHSLRRILAMCIQNKVSQASKSLKPCVKHWIFLGKEKTQCFMISSFNYEQDLFTENCAVPTSVANQDLSWRFQESTWPQCSRSFCQQVAPLRLKPSAFRPTGVMCAEMSQVYKRYFLQVTVSGP